MIGVIKPSTILVIFCNVLIFMLMQILLFWYVISKAVENIIVDKSAILRDIIKNSTAVRTRLHEYINSIEYQTIYNQSLIDKQTRTEFNMDLTWKWMMTPFLIVITILCIGSLYSIYIHRYTQYNTLKLDKTDLIVLATVFLSFLTEIIFIFVLVMRYIYVSNIDIIIFLANSKFNTYVPYTFPPFISTYVPSIP